MPGSATAEIYFIVTMMVLILVISGVSVFFFMKTYKKEMRERAKRVEKKAAAKAAVAREAKSVDQ
ncbi:MAG: hypothetical protein H0V76_08615 [Blastocatellia bacterium]|nr:hypothetical protein [Blastocatellia bacterium]